MTSIKKRSKRQNGKKLVKGGDVDKMSPKQAKHIAPVLRQFAVPIEKLKLDPDNANMHPEQSIEAIAGSLKRFGQQLPILHGGGGVVKHGNGVLIAAKQLGWTHLAALSTNQKGVNLKAMAIALNQTGRLSKVNKQVLTEQLEEISKVSDDLLKATGFGGDLEDIFKTLNGAVYPTEATDAEVASHDPGNAGVTVGAFRFSIARKKYENWIEEIRQAKGFDDKNIIREIRRRLGL